MEVADRQAEETLTPCVEVCLTDGTPTGLAFHGVPSGHEFTSFMLGLYNAAGPGQALDDTTKQQIASIQDKTDLKILVTLSCTMCPDLVVAAQRIAAANPNVTAHVYDIRHFDGLKNQYKVMSVPCLVYGEGKIAFGKKNMHQILELLAQL
jgi:thioredoxin reductase (NADPH)